MPSYVEVQRVEQKKKKLRKQVEPRVFCWNTCVAGVIYLFVRIF